MYFGGVKIPDELLRALRENEVVFFCGAGVSFPPPSDLPMFDGLAMQIAGVNKLPSGEKEDAFLGGLSRNGTNVHELAARILLKRDSAPTDLHHDLLRLFRRPEHVRIVTTNFDHHFSTANTKVFRNNKAAEHVAPSLPLGDDFSGIVYLHGAASSSHRELILTDENFGEAYITRGWARRFLIPLFQKYVVVFVGYSHQDITMTYLARGLTSFSPRPRFAFYADGKPSNEYERWESLGIEVVRYPPADKSAGNRHQSLTDCVHEWAQQSQLNLRDQLKRIRAVVRGLPPEGDDANELLTHWLETPALATEFCRAARRLEWCEWLLEHGYFDCLFEEVGSDKSKDFPSQWQKIRCLLFPKGSATCNAIPPHLRQRLEEIDADVPADVSHIFIRFAVEHVRSRFPSWLLGTISKKKRPLSSRFVASFMYELSVQPSGKPKADKYIGAWVNLLLQQRHECISGYLGARLLLRCQLPQHKVLVLAILQRLTRPHVEFEVSGFARLLRESSKEPWSQFAAAELSANLQWPNGDGHGLAHVLETFLPNAIPSMAHELCLFAIQGIESAHAFVPAVSLEALRFQRLDFGRSSIGKHEQDHYHESEILNILIDLARDTIAHLMRSDRGWATSQLACWWQSELPLLHRLALFAVANDPEASPDDLLSIVIGRRLLFSFETKKETFDLLAYAYPRALVASKEELIRSILGRNGRRKIAQNNRAGSAYERYNVLVWLNLKAPHCELAVEALKQILADNPQFLPREHPDLDGWVGPANFVDPAGGVNFPDILAGPPSLYLEQMLQAPISGFDKDRRDMCSNLKQLAEMNREWVLSFLSCAAESVAVDSALWTTILVEYSSLLKTREDWHQFKPILELLLSNKESVHGVVWLLNHALWRGSINVPEETIELCMKFVDIAWCQRSKGLGRERQFFRDWYTTAINQLGGWIGDSWVHYCLYLKKKDDRPWTGIPDDIKVRVIEAVTGNDETAFNARITITPWIAYFFVWDPEFARKHLLPLFDWSRNAEVSQQTWSVLLWYSRGSSKSMEIELRPLYKSFAQQISAAVKETGEHLEQFNQQSQNRFGHHIARIAMDVIETPERVAFLEEFISLLTPPAYEGVAQAVTYRLKEMEPNECEDAWQGWLRDYLDLRLLGRPASLTPEESEPFAEFGLTLTQSFPDFVDRFVKMPLLKIRVFDVVEVLKPSDVWKNFPVPTCRFLTHVLLCGDGYFIPNDLNEIHHSLKQAVATSSEFHELEDAMITQGWRP